MTGRFFAGAIFSVVRFKNKQSSLIGGGVLLASALITACASDSGNPWPLITDSVNNDSDELCMHCAPNSVASVSLDQGNGEAGAIDLEVALQTVHLGTPQADLHPSFARAPTIVLAQPPL